MNTIYISGKISGLPTEVYEFRFSIAENELINSGYENIINPLHIKPLFGIRKYWFHMLADVHQLLKCDTIYLKNDWADSRGARIELIVALLTGKQIMFQ
jgi:hypothetical protein